MTQPMYSWTMSTRIDLVSVSFIPSIVSGKLAINSVEFNSGKVSCYQLSIIVFVESLFTM